MDEIQSLRSTINHLKSEIGQNPVSDAALRMMGKKALAKRRELQGQLEAAYVRLAELEEVKRVEAAKKRALDSGLVEKLVETREASECPLCFEDIPTVVPVTPCAKANHVFHQLWCCGAICCTRCMDQREQRMLRIADMIGSGQSNLDSRQLEEFVAETSAVKFCPFCRSPHHGEAHLVSLARKHAEAGKTWAQFELGLIYEEGKFGVAQDQWKAAELYTLAADGGHTLAMTRLAQLWAHGFPDVGVAACQSKQKEYLLRAARQGYYSAQFLYAETLGPDQAEEALLWFTLCADQGCTAAHCKLSELHSKQYERGMLDITYRCMYWLKKAALSGEPKAQLRFTMFLLNAKCWIYDMKDDIPGYSAVPEACFWYDMIADEPHGVERPKSLNLVKCGCCGATAKPNAKLKLCTKCKGARYCGRDCQEAHWKMGHKRDCKAVEALRVALIVPSKDGYGYPVLFSPPPTSDLV